MTPLSVEAVGESTRVRRGASAGGRLGEGRIGRIEFMARQCGSVYSRACAIESVAVFACLLLFGEASAVNPLKYVDLKGQYQVTDVDSLVDVVRGPSGKRPGWRALITYAPSEGVFLELWDAPSDVRGESRSEAAEVTPDYVQVTFGLAGSQMAQLRSRPDSWFLVER